VIDLSAAARVDLHSSHALAALGDDLRAEGIAVQAVEVRAAVRDRLRREGVDAQLGGIDRFTSVADAVDGARTELAE
jgi:sulfate permease, SulP family